MADKEEIPEESRDKLPDIKKKLRQSTTIYLDPNQNVEEFYDDASDAEEVTLARLETLNYAAL